MKSRKAESTFRSFMNELNSILKRNNVNFEHSSFGTREEISIKDGYNKAYVIDIVFNDNTPYLRDGSYYKSLFASDYRKLNWRSIPDAIDIIRRYVKQYGINF